MSEVKSTMIQNLTPKGEGTTKCGLILFNIAPDSSLFQKIVPNMDQILDAARFIDDIFFFTILIIFEQGPKK